jgi:hypothetical protein
MCYGNSIINTCPQCNITDQTFEFHDCHFGSTPTETWWILPSAILEDIYITEICDECVYLNNWLDELPSAQLLSTPDNGEDFSIYENPVWDESDRISIATTETDAEDEDEEEVDHLKVICEWYDNVDRYLHSIKINFSSMRSRCTATGNAALVTQMSFLEADVDIALTSAMKRLEYVIEVSTWIRQCTSDEQKLRDTDFEELREAMYETRMSCNELARDDAVDSATQNLGNLATKVWYEMETVEAEMERYAQLYGTEEVVEVKKTTLVGRVWSMIVA